MGFQYLHLSANTDGEIYAKVATTGPSLGSETSRSSKGPFAVFQIESFTGLPQINNEDLLNELLKRFTIPQLMKRLEWQLSNDELMELIDKRLQE